MSLLTVGVSDICSAGPVSSGAVGLSGPCGDEQMLLGGCSGEGQVLCLVKCPWLLVPLSCLELVWGRSPELMSELEELCWLLMSLGAAVQTEGVAHA